MDPLEKQRAAQRRHRWAAIDGSSGKARFQQPYPFFLAALAVAISIFPVVNCAQTPGLTRRPQQALTEATRSQTVTLPCWSLPGQGFDKVAHQAEVRQFVLPRFFIMLCVERIRGNDNHHFELVQQGNQLSAVS